MAELVDAVDSKSTGSDTVRVQVPLLVPADLVISLFALLVSFSPHILAFFLFFVMTVSGYSARKLWIKRSLFLKITADQVTDFSWLWRYSAAALRDKFDKTFCPGDL